ncbi:MAG: CBS domain-containing protein [Gammaproteobacteria bacterium]
MTLPDARYLIKQYKIRRLPIVKNGVLVGIVTLTDLLEAGPSDAVALKGWEIGAQLKRITLQQIMTGAAFCADSDPLRGPGVVSNK